MFDDDNGKFVGTVVTSVAGERRYLKNLRSMDFYKNIDMIWEFINAHDGTHIWNAHVEPRHFDVMIRLIGKKYKVELVRMEMHCGIEMCYIEVTKKK